MRQITSLKARISGAEAVDRFRGGTVRGWMRSWQRGELLDARQVYVPYRLFRVTVWNRGQEQVSWLALDAVTAQLDLYQFDAPPDQADVRRVETNMALPARLSTDEVREFLIQRVRRQVYLSGFFRLRELRIEADSVGQEVYVPYWVGVYRKGDRVSIDVLNAVRKQWEGGKMRDVIQRALQERLWAN